MAGAHRQKAHKRLKAIYHFKQGERMIQSENITELLVALEAVQSELPTMPKSSQAYGYKYADLDTITQAIKPILHKHGIAYIQSIGGTSQEQTTLTTRVFNTKGQYIEDTAVLPVITNSKNNAAQTLGMSITYMRRYALCAMLGITSDEDTDANADNAVKPTAQKQAGKSNLQASKTQAQNKEQLEQVKKLLASVHPNGRAVFSENEKEKYRASYKGGIPLWKIIGELEQTKEARLAIPSVTAQDSAGANIAFDNAQQEELPVF